MFQTTNQIIKQQGALNTAHLLLQNNPLLWGRWENTYTIQTIDAAETDMFQTLQSVPPNEPSTS